MGDALGGHGKEIKPKDSGKDPAIHPQGEAASPENAKEQRNHDYTGAGDKAGLGGTGVLEAGRLKGVASKHEKAECGAGKQLFPF